jgi:hypothetical protein
MTNAGNSSVTIAQVMVAGAGFNTTGASGITLAPGQTTTLSPRLHLPRAEQPPAKLR